MNANVNFTDNELCGMLNGIRAEASDAYFDVVPDASLDNLESVGNPITSANYEPIRNEFINALFNKIVKTIIWDRVYYNRLNVLKQGINETGGDIEEIHTNPIDEQDERSCNDSDLLTGGCAPDVETAYHRLNRVKRYCTSWNRARLKRAFTSYRALNQFINTILNQLVGSNEIHEYSYTKALFGEAFNENKLVKMAAPYPTNTENATTLAQIIQNLILDFQEPTTDYNAWAQLTGQAGRVSFSNFEDIIIVIRNDVLTSLDYKLLAWAFNVDVARIKARIINVREFPGAPSLMAVVMDRNYTQIWDTDKEINDWYDPSNRCWKAYFHIEQTYSTSPFANAVGLYSETPDNTVGIVGQGTVGNTIVGKDITTKIGM